MNQSYRSFLVERDRENQGVDDVEATSDCLTMGKTSRLGQAGAESYPRYGSGPSSWGAYDMQRAHNLGKQGHITVLNLSMHIFGNALLLIKY
ncbi:hypothetical protein CsSME_00027910 [Camellia sinensis var. sinensis]